MTQCIYSRVSTTHQDTENQLAKLREMFPSAQVFEEVASGAKARPVLEQLVTNLKPGDELIVAALDRLGRRTSEILTLIEALTARGVVLKSIREGADFSTPVGKLVMTVLLSVAELERSLISERTRIALASKRAQGIVGGRRPTYSLETVEAIRKLRNQGMKLQDISRQTGMSLSRISALTRKAA